MKYIIANFKLNGQKEDIANYCNSLNSIINLPQNMIVCVPSIYTMQAANLLVGNNICVGLQNISEYTSGAYTGEISAKMALDCGAKYTLIGHSERRNIFGESNVQINNKMLSALDAGVKVVLCIGEKAEEKQQFENIVAKQIETAFKNIDKFENIIVAYEPVWAIGTGVKPSTQDIRSAIKYIKQFIYKTYKANVKVLYGGSVNSKNSSDILHIDEVDGVLVGGASLDAQEFVNIYNSQF